MNSVRLECVKHAASVHPEPGSNSLNLVYYRLPALIPNLKLLILSLLFFFFRVSKFLNEILCFFLRFVVQFSRTVSAAFFRGA